MDWGVESSIRRRTCMLMVTHACNLNCSYCYEPYKKNAHMDTDLATEIILREARFVKESDRFDELEIDFMGGEPFMNFPLIKYVVESLMFRGFALLQQMPRCLPMKSKAGYERIKTPSILVQATTEPVKCRSLIAVQRSMT